MPAIAATGNRGSFGQRRWLSSGILGQRFSRVFAVSRPRLSLARMARPYRRSRFGFATGIGRCHL